MNNRIATILRKLPEQEEFEVLYVSGGMLEVQPNSISVLADTAIRAKNLDEAKALEAKQKAAEAEGNKAGNIDFAKAEAELSQTITQMQQALKSLKKK